MEVLMYKSEVTVSLTLRVDIETEEHPEEITVKRMREIASRKLTELGEAAFGRGIKTVTLGRVEAMKPVSRIASLSPEMRERISSLFCALSPENLSGDGEYPRSVVEKRLVDLKKEWRAINKEVGFQVTEEEYWSWEFNQNREVSHG
jgi:hypothetical protein